VVLERPLMLIVEDVPEELEATRRALDRLGYEVIAARDPATALRRLRTEETRDARTGLMRWELTQNRPVVAVVDYDMRHAPDQSLSSLDLLRFLFDYSRDCEVVVHTWHATSIEVQDRIARAHPGALLQRKRDDIEQLAARIEAHVGLRVAEFEIKGRELRMYDPQNPSRLLRKFNHHVRYNLVRKYREGIVAATPTEAKICRKFRLELRKLGSTHTVMAMGNFSFRLVPLADLRTQDIAEEGDEAAVAEAALEDEDRAEAG
jgi:CheY-like chemotaxis protein